MIVRVVHILRSICNSDRAIIDLADYDKDEIVASPPSWPPPGQLFLHSEGSERFPSLGIQKSSCVCRRRFVQIQIFVCIPARPRATCAFMFGCQPWYILPKGET